MSLYKKGNGFVSEINNKYAIPFILNPFFQEQNCLQTMSDTHLLNHFNLLYECYRRWIFSWNTYTTIPGLPPRLFVSKKERKIESKIWKIRISCCTVVSEYVCKCALTSVRWYCLDVTFEWKYQFTELSTVTCSISKEL